MMTHQEKIEWMLDYAERHNVTLELKGTVGFGRDCVGIIAENECYPDYFWYAPTDYNWRIDCNFDISWTPPNAYHKHYCVAVLGHGEAAEAELYDWLKWFDDHGYTVEVVEDRAQTENSVNAYLYQDYRHARMVKKQ